MDKIRLVLVSCCAPCSCGAILEISNIIKQKSVTNYPLPCGGGRDTVAGDGVDTMPELSDQITDFVVMFFNPNIWPETEYKKRLAEQVRYCKKLGVKYHVGVSTCAGMTDYNAAHNAWLRDIRGTESAPERGARCAKCFKYRFSYAQKWAAENGYNAIASVLGVSRHKDQAQVDDCANDVLGRIQYISIKWDDEIRKKAGKTENFYRQNYCGCEFSKKI